MNLLSRNSYSSIFGDIEQLYALNITLKEELVKESNIGSAFLKIAPYLKLYSAYAHDYELALNLLQVKVLCLNVWKAFSYSYTCIQEQRKSNKDFEAFVSQQERLPHISRKLEALLIVPIQRVPRYRLLLSELVNYTERTESDHSILQAALLQIEAVAHHINEQIREQENMQRMIKIQKSLAHGKPKIVAPGRRFIKG